VESAILGALGASSLVAAGVLLLVGRGRPVPVRATDGHRGRLRLPVRAFERAVVLAIVAAVGAVVPALGGGPTVWVGAVAVAVAVAWCARRGAFLAPRAADDDLEGR
jgi:hypothetical protein